MTIYLVAWLSVAYDCPFGLGKLPTWAKEHVCRPEKSIKTRVFDPARRKKAEECLEALGPSETAVLLEVSGTQARALDAVWKHTLEIEGVRK